MADKYKYARPPELLVRMQEKVAPQPHGNPPGLAASARAGYNQTIADNPRPMKGESTRDFESKVTDIYLNNRMAAEADPAVQRKMLMSTKGSPGDNMVRFNKIARDLHKWKLKAEENRLRSIGEVPLWWKN